MSKLSSVPSDHVPLVRAVLAVAALFLVMLAGPARAETLVLVAPPPVLEDAVRQSCAPAVRVIAVNYRVATPPEIAADHRADFVVWHDGTDLVLWTASGRAIERHAMPDYPTAGEAAALAAHLTAWVAREPSAAERSFMPVAAPAPHDRRADAHTESPARPAFRFEYAFGSRANVARATDTQTQAAWSGFLRRGPLEVGVGVELGEDTRSWQQQRVTAQLRWPIDGRLPVRLSIVPRAGAGVVVAHARDLDDRAVAPVLDLGVMLERRWHRVAVGVDLGGSAAAAQTFEQGPRSVVMPAHLEGLLQLRASVLFY